MGQDKDGLCWYVYTPPPHPHGLSLVVLVRKPVQLLFFKLSQELHYWENKLDSADLNKCVKRDITLYP